MSRAARAIMEDRQPEALIVLAQLAALKRDNTLVAAQDAADAGHARLAVAMCDDVLGDQPGHPEAAEMRKVFAILRDLGE
jgi:hypothetical protein